MKDYTLVPEYPLKDIQNEMIDFCINRPLAVMQGQTGSGKTYAVLTLLLHILIKYKSAVGIIICPPKALIAFEKELSEKLKVKYSIISTDKNELRDNCRIVLVSATCLEKAIGTITELRGKYKALVGILDEAHSGLQQPNNRFYLLMQSIRPMFNVMYFLTATTCKNNIMGMYYMLSILKPEILGDYREFRNKYLVITKKNISLVRKNRERVKRTVEEISGYKNIDELRKILDQYIITRQRSYNLKFKYYRTSPNEKETKDYLNASGGDLSDKADDFWAVRLRDISLVVDNIHPNIEREEISKKEALFLKVLNRNIKSGRSCIVYCSYVETLNRLENIMSYFKNILGIDSILKIKGGVSLKKRKEIETLIGTNKPLLITSAGGESINLQRADTIIFYDLPYDISEIIQVIGRITRIDTKHNTQYIDIIELVGTTDTYRRLSFEKNMKLVESLFGKINTLPYTTFDNEQAYMKTLRKLLLWAFKRKKIATDTEIDEYLQGLHLMKMDHELDSLEFWE